MIEAPQMLFPKCSNNSHDQEGAYVDLTRSLKGARTVWRFGLSRSIFWKTAGTLTSHCGMLPRFSSGSDAY